MINIRPLQQHEYEKARELDVTETGSMIYRSENGQVVPVLHEWRRPPWTEARYAALIETWAQAVADGGVVLGAFDGDRLVGEAVFRPRITESMAQFESLRVSRDCRRQGVARRLATEVIRLARESGALVLYVSAMPTESAVNFYRSVGFVPTATPHPALFELEPEDIHMTMPL